MVALPYVFLANIISSLTHNGDQIYMNLFGDTNTDGTQVHSYYEKTGPHANEHWTMRRTGGYTNGNAQYTIMSASAGTYLTASEVNGSYYVLANYAMPSGTADNQLWYFTELGNQFFINSVHFPGAVLDVPYFSTDRTTQLQTYPQKSPAASNQLWTVKIVARNPEH